MAAPLPDAPTHAKIFRMKHTLDFDGDPEDVAVTTKGAASLAGLDAVVADLLRQSRYGPRLLMLFDHSRLDLRTLEPDDLVRRLYLALKDADLLGPKLIAVVSPDAPVAQRRQGRADEPCWRAFATVDAARTWLRSQADGRTAA
jgi:hypothetical protein